MFDIKHLVRFLTGNLLHFVISTFPIDKISPQTKLDPTHSILQRDSLCKYHTLQHISQKLNNTNKFSLDQNIKNKILLVNIYLINTQTEQYKTSHNDNIHHLLNEFHFVVSFFHYDIDGKTMVTKYVMNLSHPWYIFLKYANKLKYILPSSGFILEL